MLLLIILVVQVGCIFDIVEWLCDVGVQVCCGGGLFGDGFGGVYFQFMVFEGVCVDNLVVWEEIFGFVLMVQIFDDEEEGLVFVVYEYYGLVVGVYIVDIGCVLCVMCGIVVGMVWINCYGCSVDFVIFIGGYY